jgi:GNAT superfamily N-acetyltransferase
MIRISQATLNEIEELTILFDAYRVFYDQASDVTSAKNFLINRIQNAESVIFIAFENDKAIGFTQLYPIFTSVGMKRAWLLNDLFVNAAGRNKGVATQLLEAAKEYAKSTNAKWLMLQTGRDNKNAQALYEKNGWKKATDIFYEFSL